MSDLIWHAVHKERRYLPDDITGDREDVCNALQAIFAARGRSALVDAFTDQIDITMGGKKIAVYMAD